MHDNPESIAQKVLDLARQKGAQADVLIQHGTEFSVRVDSGAIEDLKQAAQKSLGVRVFREGRLGFASTSDFSDLATFVERAVALARETAVDPHNGLPDAFPASSEPEPETYDPRVAELGADAKIDMALRCEAAARAVDPRVRKFDGVEVGTYHGETLVANTAGQTARKRGSYVFCACNAIAEAGGELQGEHWYDQRRFLADLASPESIGRTAAQRAVRMLGARQVRSQSVPVVLEWPVASGFFGGIVAAIDGDLVYKRASFLQDKLGQRIAPAWLDIADDPRRPRAIGATAFDGEGVPTRRRPVLARGVLETFLYDAYTARKAGKPNTGHARRGTSGPPGIGPHNLVVEPGTKTPEQLVRELDRGLLVTRMLGRGANPVNGDYSRGANGLWIERGEVVHAVQEITVAGNMLQMLDALDAVANDLNLVSSVCAPTTRFRALTISGKE